MLDIADGEGKHPEGVFRRLSFSGQMKREGKVPCLQYWGHVTGMWMAYSDSANFSDQFSYKNYFHLSYGLFYMIFQSLKQFT